MLSGFSLTKLAFICEFVERQGKWSLKGEGLPVASVPTEQLQAGHGKNAYILWSGELGERLCCNGVR